MTKRGPKPGSKVTPWTEAEWTVIKAELDAHPGKSSGRVARLQPLLPNRTPPNIHNALNLERARREHRCTSCLKPLPEDAASSITCATCLEDARAKNQARKAQGLCLRCHAPVDDQGSATFCSVCSEKRRKTKSKTQRARVTFPNLLGWLCSGASQDLVQLVPSGSHVVDLFGGSGQISILTAMRPDVSLLAYNDIHPHLPPFFQTLCQPAQIPALRYCSEKFFKEITQPKKLQEAYRRLAQVPRDSNALQTLVTGALVYVTHNVLDRNMRELAFPPALRRPTNAFWQDWQRASEVLDKHAQDIGGFEVTNLDFAQAIPFHDSHGVVFLVDPPWPGARHYEHTIEGRYDELVELLMQAQGDFIITGQSSRAYLKALAPIPHLYWQRGQWGHREIIGSSFPLPTAGIPLDYRWPLDPTAFGLTAST